MSLYVDVVQDVILAVAGISAADGAVSELELGVICVGTPADYAAVLVAASRLLPLDLARLFTEINSVAVFKAASAEVSDKVGGKIAEEVQYSDYRQKVRRKPTENDICKQIYRVEKRHPFHLHRNDEVQSKLRIGVERGKCEEERHVEPVRVCDDEDRVPVPDAHEEAVCDYHQKPAQVVDGELHATPFPFEIGADGVIEQAGEEHVQYVAELWYDRKRDKPPYLSVKYARGDEGEPSCYEFTARSGILEDKDERLPCHDVEYKILDALRVVAGTPAVKFVHGHLE